MSERLDPTKFFFMNLSVGNIDGTIEVRGEEMEHASTDLMECLEMATSLNKMYPSLNQFTYVCVPIAEIREGGKLLHRHNFSNAPCDMPDPDDDMRE